MANLYITWTPSDPITTINQIVQYKLNSNSSWINAAVVGKLVRNYIITGLDLANSYDIRIQANCTLGGVTSSPIVSVEGQAYPFKWIIDPSASFCEQTNTYYNSAISQDFVKQCSAGETGSVVTYSVSAATYSSSISQQTADDLAQADITANGQTYANTNGTCTTTASPQLTGLTSGALSLVGRFDLVSRYTIQVSITDIEGTGYGDRVVTSSFGPPTSSPDGTYQKYSTPPVFSGTPADIASWFNTAVDGGGANSYTLGRGSIDISKVTNLAAVGQKVNFEIKITKNLGNAMTFPDTASGNNTYLTGFRHAPSGTLSYNGGVVPINTLSNIIAVPTTFTSTLTLSGYIRKDSGGKSVYYNIVTT